MPRARWGGRGAEEVGECAASGRVLVRVSARYYRPAEVDQLLGNPARAVARLGFNPRATPFEELVREMVLSDIELLRSGAPLASCAG